MVSRLFGTLPVRRKELERNIKREFGKVLNLMNAYALVPCAKENQGVRLTCTNQPSKGYVHFTFVACPVLFPACKKESGSLED